MINYYKKSEKEFKKFVKQNPHCTKMEWDKYAQEKCLFSANTLMFHLFHDDLIKYLDKYNIDKFMYLKSMFLQIPIQYSIGDVSNLKGIEYKYKKLFDDLLNPLKLLNFSLFYVIL